MRQSAIIPPSYFQVRPCMRGLVHHTGRDISAPIWGLHAWRANAITRAIMEPPASFLQKPAPVRSARTKGTCGLPVSCSCSLESTSPANLKGGIWRATRLTTLRNITSGSEQSKTIGESYLKIQGCELCWNPDLRKGSQAKHCARTQLRCIHSPSLMQPTNQ